MAAASGNMRFEAFCDGVFAIAVTLLALDIRIPKTAQIYNVADLWKEIVRILPAVGAFLLSFIVILITWVNHHNGSKLLQKTCSSFLYANGFLLLTIILIPFPTAMLGDYILSNHASPAVILYNAILALQAAGWVLLSRAALKNKLEKSEKAKMEIVRNGRYGYFGFLLYGLFAVLAVWIPVTIAVLTALTWIFWLILGINVRQDENS